jgi:phospholipid transport system substrate-binding protein
MTISRSTIGLVTLIILIAWTTPLTATPEPLESLRGPIDEVILILNDPQYKDPNLRSQQRDAIWIKVRGMFDFDEISQRTVARNWNMFSAQEKKEFTDVFSEFLGNTYMDKIQGEYHNEKIQYGSQEVVEGTRALVKTNILRESLAIPVDYKMKLNDNGTGWKIYDVMVEGVSLVKNYRTQFASILRKETPAQLIDRLKKKVLE